MSNPIRSAAGSRGGKRVVGNGNDFVFARDFRDRFEIDQFQQRIARRFDPDHARVLFDRVSNRRVGQIEIGEIEIGGAPPDFFEQSKRAAVKIVAHDDVRAAIEQSSAVDMAARPEAKAKPRVPLSRSAMHFS